MPAYAQFVTDVYRALDDATKCLILDELAIRDGQSLFEICTALTMHHSVGSTRQAISHRPAVLEDAALVTSERRGRTKLRFFDREPLEGITKRWPTLERTP